MNSWLDKKAYNDARYGSGGFHSGAAAAVKEKGGNHFRGFFKLRAPSLIVIVVSMVYGGYYAAITHSDYSEVGHQAFKLAFGAITQTWSQITSIVGVSNNNFMTPVVEFFAVMVSLIFALFSSLGGLIIHVCQTLFDG